MFSRRGIEASIPGAHMDEGDATSIEFRSNFDWISIGFRLDFDWISMGFRQHKNDDGYIKRVLGISSYAQSVGSA
jgi:hypothetical protein